MNKTINKRESHNVALLPISFFQFNYSVVHKPKPPLAICLGETNLSEKKLPIVVYHQPTPYRVHYCTPRRKTMNNDNDSILHFNMLLHHSHMYQQWNRMNHRNISVLLANKNVQLIPSLPERYKEKQIVSIDNQTVKQDVHQNHTDRNRLMDESIKSTTENTSSVQRNDENKTIPFVTINLPKSEENITEVIVELKEQMKRISEANQKSESTLESNRTTTSKRRTRRITQKNLNFFKSGSVAYILYKYLFLYLLGPSLRQIPELSLYQSVLLFMTMLVCIYRPLSIILIVLLLFLPSRYLLIVKTLFQRVSHKTLSVFLPYVSRFLSETQNDYYELLLKESASQSDSKEDLEEIDDDRQLSDSTTQLFDEIDSHSITSFYSLSDSLSSISLSSSSLYSLEEDLNYSGSSDELYEPPSSIDELGYQSSSEEEDDDSICIDDDDLQILKEREAKHSSSDKIQVSHPLVDTILYIISFVSFSSSIEKSRKKETLQSQQNSICSMIVECAFFM